MNSQNPRLVPGCRSLSRLLATGAMVGLTLCASLPARAAFHLWTIREVYTDASGTLQFIELFDPSGGQPLVNGQSITVSSGGTNHIITLNLSLIHISEPTRLL